LLRFWPNCRFPAAEELLTFLFVKPENLRKRNEKKTKKPPIRRLAGETKILLFYEHGKASAILGIDTNKGIFRRPISGDHEALISLLVFHNGRSLT